ncbi:amino acid-binding protein [Acerihabitans sp. TG2]|uniref:amino acid-binding protein n=1 Tax=Acerihabitans sp. TG2 TaxID=3096008 RepID=UPI002B229A0C|nr:amino acid-binding protein [Acerihabitans sp. TG2]MEA9392892.1 amino acid-binding protein [Acerihabitans sp. TG2]
MYDIYVILANIPGELGKFGNILGAAGVSLEGGGVFTFGQKGHAHFLVNDATTACAALKAQGIVVEEVNEVLIRRLDQETPGQLGTFCATLAENNINIITQYSDHHNQLILVVDDAIRARRLTQIWAGCNVSHKEE